MDKMGEVRVEEANEVSECSAEIWKMVFVKNAHRISAEDRIEIRRSDNVSIYA
jgi:hypothetical protein